MAPPHSSSFSYNLTRAYPVKWFTPVVIFGGILAATLVSFISIGTAGYQLISISSSNPNITQSEQTWFARHIGFLVDSIGPSCATTTIPLNTILYTNNTALPYTLTAVSKMGEGNARVAQGSLVYHNNPLMNCTVWRVAIELANMERPARDIAYQMQGATVDAYITCAIELDQGVTQINLTAKYDYQASSEAGHYMSFVGRNSTTQASLYWGESLLLMYWIQLTNSFHAENQDTDMYGFYKGTLVFEPQNTQAPSNPADVMSLDFFSRPSCWFIPFSASGVEDLISFCLSSVNDLADGPGTGGIDPFTSIWIPADSLSKSIIYTVLTDLGQADLTYANILTSPDLLEYFSRNVSAINESIYDAPGLWGENARLDPNLVVEPFSQSDATKYQLRVNPSTLATNYICQVPMLKPKGSLFLAVLIADLVLLQTIWKVFKFVTDYVMMKRHPEMQYCEGCRREREEANRAFEVPLVSLELPKLTHRARYVQLQDSD